MNKRGDWIQIFLILFFFLLLLMTLLLLFIERNTFNPVAASLEDDLPQQKAHIVLMSLLRQPIEFDITGDGIPDPATVADAIVHKNEQRINATFQQLPGIYTYTITYPDGTVLFTNTAQEFTPLLEEGGTVETFLRGHQGNINIIFSYVDEDTEDAALRRYVRAARAPP